MPDDVEANRDAAVRAKTDASLRAERTQTDLALAERQREIEDDADSIVAVARETADAVLGAARERADERLADGGQAADNPAALTEERLAEDAAVHDERATADESLRIEREETARSLRSLIPFEREKTDRHLLTERALWDDAVTNRDDFLSIVTHDLRGLLGGIVTATTLLAAKAPDDADGTHAVAQANRIQRYAARMNRLINDLVDVASIEAGKLSVDSALSDAAALLTEAADTFAASASSKGISVDVEVQQRPLQAVLDYARILQVVTNLVSNAVKFTPTGGRIVLRGERLGSTLRLSVSDTGPGIPAHLFETVFERFWQVDATERQGLGLGLYIARCIVDAHHGRIWAESPGDSGTTISLTLPDGVDAR